MRLQRQTRSLPLLAIGIAAALFLVVSYQYSEYTLAQINATTIGIVNSNTQIQVSDTTAVLVAKLEAVASTVKTVARTIAAGDKNVSMTSLAAAQSSTGGFTTNYFWLGSTGALLGLNNGTAQDVASFAGTNYSRAPYFVGAEGSGDPYLTDALPSLTGSSGLSIFISDAVRAPGTGNVSGPFVGVVCASIGLASLSAYLNNQVSSDLNSGVGVLDTNGTILYMSDTSLVGQNIFSPAVQAQFPPSLAGSLDSLVNQSLHGSSGISDLHAVGGNVTVGYTPIFLLGLTSAGGTNEFGTLYVMVPDSLGGNTAALISQLRTLSSFIIIAIAGLGVATAVVFLSWYRKLDDTVAERTAELVAANEQLKSYARSQTDFVNIAAHELRTPTQSILGFTEVLQDAMKESEYALAPSVHLADDEIKDAMVSITNNAYRLKKLTDDILSVSRLDGNRMPLTKERFDLNDVVQEVVDGIQKSGAVRDATCELVFERSEPSLPVVADNVKVHEVVSNLLSNAVRFSEGRGTITVRTRRTGDQALVSVEDQGKGIDPAVLPRLFTKFVTTSPSGTGLGLFIASRLVEAHGGKMWAENNGPGVRGSTFTFTIPTGINV